MSNTALGGVHFILKFGDSSGLRPVRLTEGTELLSYELAGLGGGPRFETVGRVNRHPTDPRILGLQNLSRQVWVGKPSGGHTVEVKPGQHIKLMSGTEISFSTVSGIVSEIDREETSHFGRRETHLIWLLDVSASMGENGKIQTLNNAIREVIPYLQEANDYYPNAEILVRAIKFADEARWHLGKAIAIHELQWEDVEPKRGSYKTAVGEALKLVADALKPDRIPERWMLPPRLVLASDGLHATDDFQAGLTALMGQEWGRRATRCAMPIGEEANLERMRQFVAIPKEVELLRAGDPDPRQFLRTHDPRQLTRFFSWTS
jgi:uncharacterized protein YegL